MRTPAEQRARRAKLRARLIQARKALVAVRSSTSVKPSSQRKAQDAIVQLDLLLSTLDERTQQS